VRLSGSVGSGILPSLAPGVSLVVGRSIVESVRFELGVRTFPESATDDGSYGFGLTSAMLATCWDPLRKTRIYFRGCGEAMGGLFHIYVHPTPGIAILSPGDYAWFGLAASARLGFRFTEALAVESSASLEAPLTRRQGLVQGQAAPAFEQSTVGFLGDLGLSVAF
jgi:hypothetical protein